MDEPADDRLAEKGRQWWRAHSLRRHHPDQVRGLPWRIVLVERSHVSGARWPRTQRDCDIGDEAAS